MRRVFLAAGTLTCGLTLACSAADSAEVADAQARIEAEFGPRGDPVSSGAGESGASAVGSGGAPIESADETGGAGPGDGTPPAAASDPEASGPDGARPESEAPGRVDDESGRVDDESGLAEGESGSVEDTPGGGDGGSGGGDGAPGRVEVDSLLALAHAAHASLDRLKATFTQRIENPLLGRTREGRGTWVQAGRDRFRMDFDEPPDDIYVADGSCLWLYEPSLHDQVVVSRLEEGAEIGSVDILGRLLSQARTAYEAVDEGVGDFGGVETRIVSLTPRQLPARYVEVRLWIGVSDHYVRRFRFEEETRTLRTVTLHPIEPGAPIDPALFEYVPPEGVQVFPDDVRCG